MLRSLCRDYSRESSVTIRQRRPSAKNFLVKRSFCRSILFKLFLWDQFIWLFHSLRFRPKKTIRPTRWLRGIAIVQQKNHPWSFEGSFEQLSRTNLWDHQLISPFGPKFVRLPDTIFWSTWRLTSLIRSPGDLLSSDLRHHSRLSLWDWLAHV